MRAPEVPADNPMSAAKVELGHKLFMDKRLSTDGTRSCYSCHQNELGNADGRAKALGPGDKELPRNTPTIWNVAYHTAYYWDGRSPTLEKQAIGAWKGGNMGVGEDKLAAKAAEIGALPEYKAEFARVFALKDGDPVLPEHVAKALSAYERTLLCGGTAWDKNSMNEAQQRGWELFRGKGACTTCHVGDNFSDDLYHNMGIGLSDAGEGTDKGRLDASKDPADTYKFRTPTLRNVTRTAPYFHDGSVADLRTAVKTMAGGPKREGLDPNYADRGLTDAEVDDLVAFLGALECPGSLATIGDQAVPGITGPAQPAAPRPRQLRPSDVLGSPHHAGRHLLLRALKLPAPSHRSGGRSAGSLRRQARVQGPPRRSGRLRRRRRRSEDLQQGRPQSLPQARRGR
ncbi:c-type cytochrome [Nannocystis pusilla]|uniref:C-type cytochrome n=1 Tax=Nannocystis pusilla TaxID=889268 RepID=A0A9X3EY38_9BACT|nr:c-type cytochrome [Nannocystis pusilla]